MNLNLIEERSRDLLGKINTLIALGESLDALAVQEREERDVILDTKILCYEFGNKAIIEIIEARNADLLDCRKALEKVLDTVPFRKPSGN
ncbi:MAG: hypothetical protein K2H46_02690 [Muribaculaceae bacterium]|nr:hypothetical protein [Muribaculaceae bacterium]